MNSSIDFKAASGGPTLQATIQIGFYDLSSLLDAIVTALSTADVAHTYTATANRNIMGGTQNRVAITTSGPFLSLLFGSGPRIASSAAPLIGFGSIDYTGATSYIGSSSAGIAFLPNQTLDVSQLNGYVFVPPTNMQKVFGAQNVSASGLTETISFGLQLFWQVQFKHIIDSYISTQWSALMIWAMQGRLVEFTPDITNPGVFYEGTMIVPLLSFTFKEMLPDFPNRWDTGVMKFRVKQQTLVFTGGS